MSDFVLVGKGAGARPAPRKLAPVVAIGMAASASQPTSIARTQDAVNFAREHGAVLMSQAELYDGWVAGRPGFNPANPPGRSTHEGRNDGIAYGFWPAGFAIPWWAWGQDWNEADVPQVLAAYRAEGWTATVTYPNSPSEAHHINLRKRPNTYVELHRGDDGRRVVKVANQLHLLRQPTSPRRGHIYLERRTNHFDASLEAAVARFQRQHHLPESGKVDSETATQLRVSTRHQKQHSPTAKVTRRRGHE